MTTPDEPVISANRRFGLPVTLPSSSIAIPRKVARPDLYPIRPAEPPKFIRRPSLATRRRARLMNT
jgi:hypothetical protein